MKTCIAAFAPHEYGPEYPMLTESDRILERNAPESDQGWSFRNRPLRGWLAV